jgi:16S rRNA (uracil1498-N3)-methyltransferase
LNHFFLPPASITEGAVTFPEDVSAQITKVLRLHTGDHVIVLDNVGSMFDVELEIVTPKTVEGKVISQQPAGNEPAISIQLQICLTQREKFEWILQKCTELGVSQFQPLISERTLLQKEGEVLGKYDRWRKILKEAAEQCERGRIPELLPPLALKHALKPEPDTISILLNEGEQHLSLGSLLKQFEKTEKVRLLIGPEGGFSNDEIELARSANYQSVTLGSRILRMETAAIAATTIVMNEWDDLG